MPRLIAHRGFWWPNIRLQNHPSALNAALERGWDVEVDVWRGHGQSLKVGHDRPEYEWALPSPDIGPGQIFLHLKGPSIEGYSWSEERIKEIVVESGWVDRASVFVSPLRQAVPSALPYVDVVKDRVDLGIVTAGASGVWVEQPDEDWITERDIKTFQEDFLDHRVPVYVLSPELHGRQVHLENVMQWKDADGIVTDTPHLFEQIFDDNNTIVHPQGAWW